VIVPAGPAQYEFTVKRSRFIGEVWSIASREEAETILRDLRAIHADARHVVYAFVIGDESSELLGMSDDGEPRGTAGRPVLEVLKGSGVRNCMVTVVRYFGGTKLGTGGLVHAYGDAAKGCLARVETEERRDLRRAWLTCPYERHQAVRSSLIDAGAEIVDESFAETVSMACLVERDAVGDIRRRLSDVSRGTITLTVEGDDGIGE